MRLLLKAEAVRVVGGVGGVVSGRVLTVAIVEYGPRLPTASFARTRYEYDVFGVRPVLLYVVTVAPRETIWAKLEQLTPWHRSTRYPATPTLSVAADQERSTRALLTAVAESGPGAEGGCVSVGAPRKATSCINHGEPAITLAVARYVPVEFTILSSTRSASGSVMIRLVQPLPAELVTALVMFAAKRRS